MAVHVSILRLHPYAAKLKFRPERAMFKRVIDGEDVPSVTWTYPKKLRDKQRSHSVAVR